MMKQFLTQSVTLLILSFLSPAFLHAQIVTDERFLPAYRLGRGGFFRKSGNYMYRRYDGYCISGRAVPLV